MNNANYLIRILVVDDDKMILRVISKILKARFGDLVEITETDDVQMALRTAEANHFDLYISDLDMPGINGLKLLKAIKHFDNLIQVIILTGHPNENAIRSAFMLGADDYLLKPIAADELCNSVQFMYNRVCRLRAEVQNATKDTINTQASAITNLPLDNEFQASALANFSD